MKPLEEKKKKKGVVILLSARRGRIKIRHLLFGVGHGGDAPGKNINTYLYIYLNLYLQTDRWINNLKANVEKHNVVL